VLVGLAAKNAILIVEFARDIEHEGRERLESVIEAKSAGRELTLALRRTPRAAGRLLA